MKKRGDGPERGLHTWDEVGVRCGCCMRSDCGVRCTCHVGADQRNLERRDRAQGPGPGPLIEALGVRGEVKEERWDAMGGDGMMEEMQCSPAAADDCEKLKLPRAS